MSRVNIDAAAFTDPRFGALALAMGWQDHYTAIGRMAGLWLQCTLRETYSLPVKQIAVLLGSTDADLVKQNLLECELAAENDDGTLRICGTTGRIEWLAAKRKAGAKGGKAKGSQLRRGKKQNSASALPPAEAEHGFATPPPAPAPAPTPTPAPAHLPPNPQGGSNVGVVVDYLNERLGREGAARYQPKGKTAKLIRARIADGVGVRELKLVCWHKSREWRGTEWETYLRPSTLFCKSKFDEYLPAAEAALAARERDKPAERAAYTPPAVLEELANANRG